MLAARLMKSNMKLKMTSELARRRRGARAISGNRQPLGSIRKNANASVGISARMVAYEEIALVGPYADVGYRLGRLPKFL